MQTILLQDGQLRYQSDFVMCPDKLYQTLVETLNWQQGHIKLFGKSHQIPRLQCWYGDKAYRYSNTTLQPVPMPENLVLIKQQIETLLETEFNSVLGNWYQTGQHGMGFHSDNEPELGQSPTIAMVTLGAERILHFKHNTAQARFKLAPQNGSLLVMEGALQQHWKHGVNKSARDWPGRITLTFRHILN